MEFLTGHKLNAAIEQIIRDATKELLIVSPYIKLHERFMEALKTLHEKPHVRVSLLFGKANGDNTSTFHKDSITFFKELPNIEIAHRQNLHAKFYANEYDSVMTSMNLYSYSQDVNIEAGYKISRTESKAQANEAQDMAWQHFFEIFSGADEMFIKEARFESKLFGLSKQYSGSEVVLDSLNEDATPPKEGQPKKKRSKHDERRRRTNDQDDSHDARTVKPEPPTSKESKPGFCIATGEPITFNIEKPLSYSAFKNWRDWTGGDSMAPMKYCHFSGEPSKGKTTVERPILNKHWKSAQSVMLSE